MPTKSTSTVDTLTPDNMEGSKSEYTVIVGAISNVVMIVLQAFFGIELPEGVWAGINTFFGFVLALTLGARLSRLQHTADESQASQPGAQNAPVKQPQPGVLEEGGIG
jgi:hypothetical protein